jgi:hypothetical protein
MTVSLRLIDYYWDGANYIAGATFTFTPGPKSISKSVEIQWRVAHRGRRKLKKAKFRTRETTTWTLQGSCQGSYSADALANQIEFYAKKNSKFKVIMDANTPQSFLCPDPAGGNAHTWEVVFVVIKSAKFTQTEGKIGWLDYSVELERVNCENITGYTDPWTCTV